MANPEFQETAFAPSRKKTSLDDRSSVAATDRQSVVPSAIDRSKLSRIKPRRTTSTSGKGSRSDQQGFLSCLDFVVSFRNDFNVFITMLP